MRWRHTDARAEEGMTPWRSFCRHHRPSDAGSWFDQFDPLPYVYLSAVCCVVVTPCSLGRIVCWVRIGDSLLLDFVLWALGFGLWALGFGLWALGFGLWVVLVWLHATQYSTVAFSWANNVQ